ncbi:MAG: heme exporter protein CcmD [Pseudomonadota bacterium]
MIFADLNDLLHMGGHGVYVWTTYAAAVLLLVWLVAMPLLRRRRLLADVARQARRDAALGQATERDTEN